MELVMQSTVTTDLERVMVRTGDMVAVYWCRNDAASSLQVATLQQEVLALRARLFVMADTLASRTGLTIPVVQEWSKRAAEACDENDNYPPLEG